MRYSNHSNQRTQLLTMSTTPCTPLWSRAIRFIAAEDDAVHIGEPVELSVDVGLATFAGEEVKVNELAGSSLLDLEAQFTGKVLTVKTVLSPITEDETFSIRCVGLNVRGSRALVVPGTDALLHSTRNTLLKPGSRCPRSLSSSSSPTPLSPVRFPTPSSFTRIGKTIRYVSSLIPSLRGAERREQADFESEVSLIIGKTCRDVSEEDALSYVLGYCSSNDVSARKWQGGPDKYVRHPLSLGDLADPCFAGLEHLSGASCAGYDPELRNLLT